MHVNYCESSESVLDVVVLGQTRCVSADFVGLMHALSGGMLLKGECKLTAQTAGWDVGPGESAGMAAAAQNPHPIQRESIRTPSATQSLCCEWPVQGKGHGLFSCRSGQGPPQPAMCSRTFQKHP